MSAPAALEVEGLGLRYGAHRALDEVHFEVARGEVVALVGPSGCGKTSLLRCLTWLTPPTEGFVRIDGDWLGRERDHAGLVRRHGRREIDRMRPRVGMVFQSLNLWPHLSVRENVERPQRVVLGRDPSTARDRADGTLSRLRIAELAAKRPAQLSGGQRQRVAIARALAMDPALMLFDEPTSALDAELISEVLALLRELADQGTTMLVVTHEIGFARHVANRMLFMDQGRIIAEGPPATVIDHETNPRVRGFFDKLLAFRDTRPPPGEPAGETA
jgi:polar amino acid transport system ATP-binding protein